MGDTGDEANNARITLHAGTVELFPDKELAVPSKVTLAVKFTSEILGGDSVWFAGSPNSWSGQRMTKNSADPLLYEITLDIPVGTVQFKVTVGKTFSYAHAYYSEAMDGTKGDGYGGQNGLVNITKTETYFKLFNKDQTPPATSEEFMITGSNGVLKSLNWVTKTSNSTYLFKATEDPDVYTLQLTFQGNEEFKVKTSCDNWDGLNLGTGHYIADDSGGSVTTYFTYSGSDNANVKCKKACTALLSLNISTGKVTIKIVSAA